jgi:hypothetical protein
LALTESADPPFTTADIVACVFRLRDVAEVLAALSIKLEDLASGAGVAAEIANAAAQRYRLQLHDAMAIWRFVSAKVTRDKVRDHAIDQVITDRPQDFIKTDVRPDLPMAVKHLDDEEFVYGWDNLKPAPRAGHHWALDDLPSEAS